MTATISGPYGEGDYVLLRFIRNPRTDRTAAGVTYVAAGGTWVPDNAGFLGELVRQTPDYEEISVTDAFSVCDCKRCRRAAPPSPRTISAG
jgi:hypothetical protein